jgi:hypothetical protein
MHAVSLDLTVNLGNLITIAGFIIGGWIFVWAMRSRLDILTIEIQVLKDNSSEQSKQLIEFAKALVNLARQEERVSALDRRVDELRHGIGWVTGPKGIDREYGAK